MNPLVKNEETGFLEADNEWSFTSERKIKFLGIAKDYVVNFNEFPLIPAICDKVGINLRTFERHLKQDGHFKDEWKEIIYRLKGVYTNSLAQKAASKNGIVATLAILKYLETGTFVDRYQIINSGDQLSDDKRVNEAIIIDVDAEIAGNQGNSSGNDKAPA